MEDKYPVFLLTRSPKCKRERVENPKDRRKDRKTPKSETRLTGRNYLPFRRVFFAQRLTEVLSDGTKKKRKNVLDCPHLPLQPYEIVSRRLTHLFVSNRMETISYGCRGNSEHEDIFTFFRPFSLTSHSIFLIVKCSRYESLK